MMHALNTATLTVSNDAPNLDALANELWTILQREASPAARASRRVIETMLAYAAEAEQRLADQATRIRYLETLSTTDELTGLLNRRGFDDALQRALANAERHGETGLIAYIDLDGFKTINDTRGHAAGDTVLFAVAGLLREHARQTDVIARLGGDEFAILFARADVPGLKGRLRALNRMLNSAVVSAGGADVRLAASMGLVPYGPGSDAGALIGEADAAMYRKKRSRKRR